MDVQCEDEDEEVIMYGDQELALKNMTKPHTMN